MISKISSSEKDLLCDLLRKWGITDDPNTIIEKLWHNDHIKCNEHGCISVLILKDCNLAGSIPSSIGGLLKSLEILDLSGNRLTGSIPTSFGGLLKLQKLNLSGNQLSGTIPESLGNLVNLEKLDLEHNNDMTGSIPGLGNMCELFLKGTKISMYKLDANERKILHDALKQWGYESPEQLIDELIRENSIKYNDWGMYELTIREKNLRGKIPDEIGELVKLEKLDLRNNHLNGKIPESIGKLKELKFIDLSLNELEGPIPITIGSLINIKKLDLHSNQLSGQMPGQLGHLSELTELLLSNNCLSGWIPDNLSHCINLESIDVSNNKIGGPIPEPIATLAHLKVLDLQNNLAMEGSMPAMRSVDCQVKIQGTGINSVTIKTKELNGISDYIMVALHTLLGYVNLATDCLSLYTFYSLNNTSLFALNLAFIGYSFILSMVAAWPNPKAMLYSLLQIQAALEGYMTLKTGHQTDGLQSSKKVDAICRALPSMVIQLYSILAVIDQLSTTNIGRLFASVLVGLVGASFTLAQLDANSGDSMFSIYFIVHLIYYLAEVAFRVIVITLMFLSVQYYGAIVCGIDIIVRFVVIQLIFGAEVKYTDTIIMASMQFGSDYQVVGHGRICVYIGFAIQTVEAIIFLIMLYQYDDDSEILSTLVNQGVALEILIVACVCWLTRAVLMATRVLDIIIDAPIIVTHEVYEIPKEEGPKQEEIELI